MDSVHKRLMTWISSFFRSASAEPVTPMEPLQISALPTFAQIFKLAENLPNDSRKFFMPGPLEDETFLIGRDAQLAELDGALNHWQEGHPTSVALVGPQGCGKTSLLNCFWRQRLQNQNVLRGEIEERLRSEADVLEFFHRIFQVDPPVDDMETLIAQLMRIEPRIIVLEGAHNLLLRVIGGRKAAEAFVHTIICTRQRHLWLLTCRHFPWSNMERHFNVSRYFSHVIAVDPLPEESLREALALRLKRCGLDVAFCRSREDAEEGRQPKSDDSSNMEDDFYRALMVDSRRNFHAALYFLMLCGRYEASTRSLLLWPPEPLDITFVKGMDRAYQLALAELIYHGVFSPSEHGRIFRTLGIQSRVIFEYLEQLKLLSPVVGRDNGKEKAYDLSPVIHHAVTSALEQINLLY